MHLVDDEQIRKDIQAVCQVQVLVETNPEAGDFEIKDDFFWWMGWSLSELEKQKSGIK